MVLPDLSIALPEIFLAVTAMALLMIGAFRGNKSTSLISWLSVLAFVVTGVLVQIEAQTSVTAFGGLYRDDAFGIFMKTLCLGASAFAIIMSIDYNRREKLARFEFPILIVIATLGMMVMISANDLMSVYLGIELMSLSLYVTAAFKRDSVRSTEAGLKYFVLGALSSGMLLYGMSLIYGFTGTTNFDTLADLLAAGREGMDLGLLIGLVFLIAGLAFKVSAVPFHMWTPDVYEGVPTPVTSFFAAAPKVAAIALFLRVFISPFGEMVAQWQQIIVFISVASMILGAFAAINQKNIKRLMAYSSIGHIGYALVGLAAGTEEGVRGVLIYMAIYVVMNVGTFACILSMRHRDGMVEDISELAGLSKTQPYMAFAFLLFMFSLAGIPPLAGFFGKFYIFVAAINAGLIPLAVIGLVTSVVGAFYYLRIVKIIYFDDAAEGFEPSSRTQSVIMTASALFVGLFVLFPAPLLEGASAAAAVLFS
ncbi:MAG: NADH-quinone oxidoreductase subunit NuoN [Sneathiella sp.]|jgi:NADH-quinone oxidoreductase subunit N|uniref:NADH-quinone oxidoreductase subunit NuoN n=1 Tax=Sneathiella sp. TaxID=1964365 RepID=UPI000C49D26D|nr:NADH-quinone oxidoreductase subunit NuoN [Sneathiella sp.]MAL79722.1 NADH-quinone oxidoreductase subunit NuoN [Sneathiella sp.]